MTASVGLLLVCVVPFMAAHFCAADLSAFTKGILRQPSHLTDFSEPRSVPLFAAFSLPVWRMTLRESIAALVRQLTTFQ
jgi:hypothetical protein